MKLGDLIAYGHYVKAAEAIARPLKVQEKLSSSQKNRTLDAAQKLITDIDIPIAGHFL